MNPAGVIVTLATLGVLFVAWHRYRARWLASERLGAIIGAPTDTAPREPGRRTISPFPPRYRVVPPACGLLLAVMLWLVVGLRLEISVAAGILVAVLAHVGEAYLADQKQATIEAQLAEAIDLLVGSLRAGASLLSAFESALQEAERPLRPYLQEVAGRIRLGDDPRDAVSDLPVYVPLETFRLFATSLAIHWEVGGSLATTLSTVGRTVRDRIELSRRVRAQGVEAHASVAVVLILAYVLGFLMWRANPSRLEALVESGVGTELVAGVITLQAIGLVWMSKLSRAES